MTNWHFIHDYETLAQNCLNGAAINCAYVVFDWDRFLDNPYTFEELVKETQYDKFLVKEQVKDFGYKIEDSTLDWWKQQDKEVRKKILPDESDISLKQFCYNMFTYLKDYDIKYWWSRSNTFDPIFTQRFAELSGMTNEFRESLKFWLVRDTRTFIDAKTNFNKKMNSFIPTPPHIVINKHDCIHDVAIDVLRLQALIRYENDLEMYVEKK